MNESDDLAASKDAAYGNLYDLLSLAPVGHSQLAQCDGLRSALMAHIDAQSEVPPTLAAQIIMTILVQLCEEARSAVLNGNLTLNTHQARYIHCVAVAGELLGITNEEDFQRRVAFSDREKYEFGRSQAVTRKSQRQLRAALWLPDQRYSARTGKRAEEEAISALRVAFSRYFTPERTTELRSHITKKLAEHQDRRNGLSPSPPNQPFIRDPQSWPYFLVPTGSGQPIDWHAVLDGSALTPAYALSDAIVDRRTRYVNEEMGVDEVLRWLGQRAGRTVFLEGDAGDGKTSYLNLLAARSQDSHVFLHWKQHDVPFDLDLLENYRQSLGSQLSPGHEPPVLVVTCDLDPFAERSTKQRLFNGLSIRSQKGDAVVVLVSGRPREMSWLRRRGIVGDTLKFADADHADARLWVALLARARHHLLTDGSESEASLDVKYPNLSDFLRLDTASQASILCDRRSPTIVRLLRAVYGPRMPQLLLEELTGLKEKDERAYFHICMASMIGRGVAEPLLEKFAPGAKFDQRSKRDPWIRDESGRHHARHPAIAQVVLEKCGEKQTLLRRCFSDYTQNIRSNPTSLPLLHGVLSAIPDLDRIGEPSEFAKLRSSIISYGREALSSVSDLTGAVAGQCGDDYWAYYEWIALIGSLIPDEPRDKLFLRIVDIQRDLLARARRTPNCPTVDWLDFQDLKLQMLRKRLGGESDSELRDEVIVRLLPMVGSPWCKQDFYVHLFWQARYVIGDLTRERVPAESVAEVKTLYRAMATAFEHLRGLNKVGRVDDSVYRAFLGPLQNSMSVHLPPDELHDLLESVWHLSVQLEVPDVDIAGIYADLLAVGDRERAIQILLEASDANPLAARPLFLLAKLGYTDIDDLKRRIEVAEAVDQQPLPRARLRHASAMVETDPDRRVELLHKTAMGYDEFVRLRQPSPGIFASVGPDWESVCRALREADAESWRACEGRYQAVKGSVEL